MFDDNEFFVFRYIVDGYAVYFSIKHIIIINIRQYVGVLTESMSYLEAESLVENETVKVVEFDGSFLSYEDLKKLFEDGDVSAE